MIVSDYPIQAEGLGGFLKSLGKKGFNVSKKLAKNALKLLSRFLKLTDEVATAAPNRNSIAALSTLLEVINFYRTGSGNFYNLY